MLYVQSSQGIWQHTLELAWQLDRQGRVLPIQDIHIAACALSINAVVLTHDQHFQEIPGLDATDRIL
jgi:predicted nucleic acid-binding protein